MGPAALAGLVLLSLLPIAAGAGSVADSLDQVTDLMRVGRMDEALENLTVMQEANPEHLRAWMIRGLILAYIGNADGGIAEANDRLATDGEDGGGLALAVGIAVAVGDGATAEDASARLVSAHSESADAWDIRGGVLSLAGDEASVLDAEAAFDRALAIDPRHVDALINRGELAGPTDPDAAERFLRRAVAARPASTDANDALTAFLVGQDRTAAALEAYDAWLGASPANPIALMGKATVLADGGKYEEALWLIENAVRNDPGYRDGLLLKGQLLLALGRPAETVETMNDLLSMYPGDEEAQSLMSDAAAAVQSAGTTRNATTPATTPAERSPAPVIAAGIALALAAAGLRRVG